MKITFYGYNTFVIETQDKKIAIDPGADLYFFNLKTLIPKSEWESITHIFVTHGDPDHHWHTDRVAKASHAQVICNNTMIKEKKGEQLMLGSRDKGIAFTMPVKNMHLIGVDETIELDGMKITGIKATHGSLKIKIGPFSKTLSPGPKERIGWGAIGFLIQLDGKTLVNLGDTLLHADEWKQIKNPDVLMIPIGGTKVHNTMDEKEALEAVKIMQPKLVIPCHYNCRGFFEKNGNAADDLMFKNEVIKLGSNCQILRLGESFRIEN